jgi:hypothetical protein
VKTFAKPHWTTIPLLAAMATTGARVAHASDNTADAPDPSASASPTGENTPSRWMTRLQIGIRWMLPSDERALLAQDGYDFSSTYALTGDFAWYVTPVLGAGAWVDHSIRKSTPQFGGPTLTQSFYAGGVEAPLRLTRSRACELLLIPKLGYGWSFLDFGGDDHPLHAIGYGGDVSVLFPRAHISLTASWLNGPTGRPTGAGRDYNFGGIAVLLGGMIDG